MQVFATKVISEEHETEFHWAVALSCVWAVKSISLSIDLRVVESDQNFIIVSRRLKIDT